MNSTITNDPTFKALERLAAECIVEARTETIKALPASPRFPELERSARRLFGARWNLGLAKLVALLAEVEGFPPILQMLRECAETGIADRAEIFRRARLIGAALVPAVADVLAEPATADRN